MQVILIRHTSVDVPRGTCYRQSDVDVAITFPEEAASTKAALKEFLPIDIAFTSPLKRATMLADYCGFYSAIRDDRLKEMSMGRWEMQRYDEIDDPQLEKWYANYMHEPTTGGESFDDLYRRVAEFLNELKTKNYRRVAIFAHAGVLVAAGIYANLFAPDNAFTHQVPYGGLQVIEI